jgi:enterochelin esterase-like enzyme
MKWFSIILICFSFSLKAQKNLFYELLAAAKNEDSTQRKVETDKIWNSLRHQNRIPFIEDDSVTFLYRGNATSVQWTGDFNGWGFSKKINTNGQRISGTNIWFLKCSFPQNARFDYKINIDGDQLIIDPENIHHQWSGVGGGSINSELRMPKWKEDDNLIEKSDVPKGKVIRDLLIHSSILDYQITYNVYVPVGAESSRLPVIYVTDGYEYMHPEMGHMLTVLDNLIARKKIKPVIAVFIDHREPINRANNKRMEELAMNTKYLQFFTDELIPKIETTYPALPGAANRAIMGTSMGGLTAAYFVFAKPDVFSMAGIQSPAFYTRPQIYQLCDNPSNTKIKISMTSGTFNDASEGGQKMKKIFETNACVYTYREVNEGHSWGNWRNLIDDVLIDLFGNQ